MPSPPQAGCTVFCTCMLIVVFAYFYMTIQYNPIEMANNLRQQ